MDFNNELNTIDQDTTFNYEEQPSRLQSLKDSLESIKEELKNEYLNLFRTSPETQEALQELQDNGTLRYTYKGLYRSLPMEFNDFDESASEAFDEFCQENNIEADLTLGFISTKLDNYMIYVDHGVSASLSVCENGVEETIPMTRLARTNMQILDLLSQTKNDRNFQGMVLLCSEVGNVTEVEHV